jgi:hypothetical protein
LVKKKLASKEKENVFWLTGIVVVNIQSQMASALAVEADYPGSLEAIMHGKVAAEETGSTELKVFFAASELHVHLLHWDDSQVVDSAVQGCASLWEEIPSYQVCFTGCSFGSVVGPTGKWDSHVLEHRLKFYNFEPLQFC